MFSALHSILTGDSCTTLIEEVAWLPQLPECSGRLDIVDNALALYDNKTRLAIRADCLPSLLKETRERMFKTDNFTEDELLKASWIMLLINPEHSLSYRVRKQALLKGQLSPVKELAFIRMILSRRCAPICWHHRLWIVHEFPLVAGDVILQELSFCDWAASKWPRDYYLWKYRLCFIRQSCTTFTNDCCDDIKSHEIRNMLSFVSKNPTNRSAQAYLETILLSFGNSSKISIAIDNALKSQTMFPEITSLKYHLMTLNCINNRQSSADA